MVLFYFTLKFCTNMLLGAHLMYIWAGSGKIAGTTQNMHMWGQGRILISRSAVRVVVKERHSFFLINHAQIKENIFWPCSLGLISTYQVDSVTSKSPNFYVTSGIRDCGAAKYKCYLVTYRKMFCKFLGQDVHYWLQNFSRYLQY
jgi:hypothetical protein